MTRWVGMAFVRRGAGAPSRYRLQAGLINAVDFALVPQLLVCWLSFSLLQAPARSACRSSTLRVASSAARRQTIALRKRTRLLLSVRFAGMAAFLNAWLCAAGGCYKARSFDP
jgi:hypothetical protein